MSILQLTKTANALVAANKKVADLEARVVEFEKRAAAEGFLIEMMESPRAPFALKPSSVADFLEKRAAIEKQDLEVAKLAAKMAGSHGFEIGSPETPAPLFQSTGSQADDEFIAYLLGTSSQG